MREGEQVRELAREDLHLLREERSLCGRVSGELRERERLGHRGGDPDDSGRDRADAPEAQRQPEERHPVGADPE